MFFNIYYLFCIIIMSFIEENGIKYKILNDNEVEVVGLINNTLKNIKLTEKVQNKIVVSIGQSAFAESNITSINIPNSVTLIDSGGFGKTSSLTEINIDINNSLLNTINYGAFIRSAIKSINIPNNVTLINNAAFYSTSSLTQINISISESKLNKIGNSAFALSAIKSINIPKSVTLIEQYAFYSTNLTVNFLGNKPSTINEKAFYVFNGIGYYDPIYSESWKDTTIIDNLEIRQNTADKNIPNKYIFNDNNFSYIKLNDNDFILLELINKSLKKIKIPKKFQDKTVKIIGKNAFYRSYINNINIPNSVTLIDEGAFGETSSLTDVIINSDSQLLTMGNGAFYQSAITSINIPNSVTLIDNSAFGETSSLIKVIINSDSKLSKIGGFAFNKSAIKSINIPNSITLIDSNAFDNTNINIYFLGNKPAIINKNAFNVNSGVGYYDSTYSESWKGITKIDNLQIKPFIIENGIGYKILNDNEIEVVELIDNTLKNIKLPNKVQNKIVVSIGDSAFLKSNITSINIPNSVKLIDSRAFGKTLSLTKINIDINNSLLNTIMYDAFNRSSIQNINIPNNVTLIETGAFAVTESLTKININILKSKLTTIKAGAFALSAIKSINIPKSVTLIEYSAFDKTNITVYFSGNKPTTINKDAFNVTSGTGYYDPNNNSWKGITKIDNLEIKPNIIITTRASKKKSYKTSSSKKSNTSNNNSLSKYMPIIMILGISLICFLIYIIYFVL